MIYFDDLMCGSNLRGRASGLACPARKTHGFPALHQLGIVVPDVEEAAAVLETSGFGPFFIARGAPVLWHETGQKRRVAGKMGLAYHDGLEIELLEPLDGSALYREALDPARRPVVHHLGFLVNDVDVWAKRLQSAGIGVRVRGRLKTGAVTTDFVYLAPNEDDGLVMEFISWKFFGRRMKPGPAIARTIGRMQKWTGRRCLSL